MDAHVCIVESHHAGHWHQVAEFAAGNPSAEAAAKAGIEALCSLDERSAFRLLDSRNRRPLMYYCFARGWTLARGLERR